MKLALIYVYLEDGRLLHVTCIDTCGNIPTTGKLFRNSTLGTLSAANLIPQICCFAAQITLSDIREGSTARYVHPTFELLSLAIASGHILP